MSAQVVIGAAMGVLAMNAALIFRHFAGGDCPDYGLFQNNEAVATQKRVPLPLPGKP